MALQLPLLCPLRRGYCHTPAAADADPVQLVYWWVECGLLLEVLQVSNIFF